VVSLKSRWPQAKKAALARDGETCQSCGGRATDVHHRVRRGMGSSSSEAIYLGLGNLISLCRQCHNRVHAEPMWAYKQGLSVRSWWDPETAPVKTFTDGLVFLTPEGGVKPW